MEKRPLLLDLFCGAGGAAMGYHRAGFDVVGVDLQPQPRYPFRFIQADALTFPLDGFDAIHASPPCQANSVTRHIVSATRWRETPDLVTPVYTRLRGVGVPWVMENVNGAPMPDSIMLCASMFGLPMIRHRLFASSHLLFAPAACAHTTHLVEVIGGKVRGIGAYRNSDAFITPGGHKQRREAALRKSDAQTAMGIDWMTISEMCESFPPTYTEWIGRQLLTALAAGKVA